MQLQLVASVPGPELISSSSKPGAGDEVFLALCRASIAKLLIPELLDKEKPQNDPAIMLFHIDPLCKTANRAVK